MAKLLFQRTQFSGTHTGQLTTACNLSTSGYLTALLAPKDTTHNHMMVTAQRGGLQGPCPEVSVISSTVATQMSSQREKASRILVPLRKWTGGYRSSPYSRSHIKNFHSKRCMCLCVRVHGHECTPIDTNVHTLAWRSKFRFFCCNARYTDDKTGLHLEFTVNESCFFFFCS